MFSLIFAIISIGLVVALAAGTMYYLSISTDKHAKEAAAAGLLTQGEQIVAAIDMRSVTADGDLTNLQQLVARNYLSSLPTPAAGTYADGLVAKDSDWWLLAPGMLPAVMLQNKLDAETCLAVNRKLGLEGIKSKPDAGRRIQCFGDAAPYTLLLNPSAKPEVLGPAIESWNRCVADPTSPGCTSTTTPEPFCVANPTDAACTTSTSTPVCVADPTNALCVPLPPDKSFCELNPTHASCGTSPTDLCTTEPTNPLCVPQPPGQSFCELNPTAVACAPTIPTPVCVTNPTHAYCITTPPPPGGGGGGSYCKLPLGCTYCWMSNPTNGSCLTTPPGAEPDLPFVMPTTAQPVPAPELNGGTDTCVPVVKEASGGYAVKSSCNASWCQNAIDGGSWTIIGTETTGLYGCKPSGASTLPLCTLDIAIDTVYNRPELRTNPVIAAWFETDSGWLLWSDEFGWHWDAGDVANSRYADLAAFKAEVAEYTIAPQNLLSSLPADVCVPPPTTATSCLPVTVVQPATPVLSANSATELPPLFTGFGFSITRDGGIRDMAMVATLPCDEVANWTVTNVNIGPSHWGTGAYASGGDQWYGTISTTEAGGVSTSGTPLTLANVDRGGFYAYPGANRFGIDPSSDKLCNLAISAEPWFTLEAPFVANHTAVKATVTYHYTDPVTGAMKHAKTEVVPAMPSIGNPQFADVRAPAETDYEWLYRYSYQLDYTGVMREVSDFVSAVPVAKPDPDLYITQYTLNEPCIAANWCRASPATWDIVPREGQTYACEPPPPPPLPPASVVIDTSASYCTTHESHPFYRISGNTLTLPVVPTNSTLRTYINNAGAHSINFASLSYADMSTSGTTNPGPYGSSWLVSADWVNYYMGPPTAHAGIGRMLELTQTSYGDSRINYSTVTVNDPALPTSGAPVVIQLVDGAGVLAPVTVTAYCDLSTGTVVGNYESGGLSYPITRYKAVVSIINGSVIN